jgi:CBS domain-containing protein
MDRQQISKWMKRNVVSAEPDMTVREAATLVIEKKVGTLPVVDEAGTLVGVISMGDIIQILLPDFVSLLSDIGFIKDYGALESPSLENLEEVGRLSVADIMRDPVVVEDNCALIRALSVMEKHNLRDLLVVKEGILVGIASRVDIGRAFLISWPISQADEPEAH